MKTQQREIVKDVKHLRELIKAERYSYFIALAGGLVRSSKDIELTKNGKFKIINYVDDSKQTLTEKELYTHSNIGEAIDKHAFIVE